MSVIKSLQTLGFEYCQRVVIEHVLPQIDNGRFPIKRCVGDRVRVLATIHTDGTDSIHAVIRYRVSTDPKWVEAPLHLIDPGKDLWEGFFEVNRLGTYEYILQAWIDPFSTWRAKLIKKFEAHQDIEQDLREGALLLGAVGNSAPGNDQEFIRRTIEIFNGTGEIAGRVDGARAERLVSLMERYATRDHATTYHTLGVRVERERARFGAWYEMFPRSAGPTDKRSATFREAESHLEGIAQMGFNVLYLTPFHPIGKSFRKGPNNTPHAGPQDPGSPWAIGATEGGHKSVHPGLGTLGDFDHFVDTATHLGLEIALDLTYQCSPDHPYVREHPEWFHHRPDGSIHYAENPPKKYEDTYPINFECDDWQALWKELKEIVTFWIQHNIKIFRVDNPHTKPFRFWEWLIHEIQTEYPDIIFLAEAFTRPAGMENLSKLGFSQSYTYFTWQNTKVELKDYLTELTQTEVCEYLRPNFFANTPDILSAFLQKGGRPAFQIRLILAATLAASYGIYGPPFELCETRAFAGTEDYVDSEKYQIRQWAWDQPGHIKPLITQLNRIRHENAALRLNTNLHFYSIDNPQLLAYGKSTKDRSNHIVVVVNLDPKNAQWGWIQLSGGELPVRDSYEVRDLLTGNTYSWHGDRNFVRLDPSLGQHAHIFEVNYGSR
jgi:starch synthase (maltosyl-transferring)